MPSSFWSAMLFGLLTSVAALAAGALLFTGRASSRMAERLTAFAAGVLLATAFLDLLPEAGAALHVSAYSWALGGFLGFWALERAIRSFHFHGRIEDEEQPSSALIMIGDSVHKLLDGIVIAAAFITGPRLGIATALAVAVHEIPHVIGDFAVLLHNGLEKRLVLMLNVLSSTVALLGIALTFGAGVSAPWITQPLIAITAGFFIYTAGSDLIPEMQRHRRAGEAAWLLGGVAAVSLLA